MVTVPKRANLKDSSWRGNLIYQQQYLHQNQSSPTQAHSQSLLLLRLLQTTPLPVGGVPHISIPPPIMASRRRTLQIFLSILALILVGTVVVLSSISVYLSIDNAAYLTEDEVGYPDGDATWNATAHGKVERIPRILHQTWKSETLPDRWKDISQECRDMMHD